MNDRLPGSSWSNPIWYREKWRIYLGDADVPGFEYVFTHDDFDGAVDARDSRQGYGRTVESCKKQIDEAFYDENA